MSSNGESSDRLSIEITGGLPTEIEEGLYKALSHAPDGTLGTTRLLRLREAIKSGAVPNYEQDWAGFGYLYFAANFVKAWLAARHLVDTPHASPTTLVDLGCGAGASTAGALMALQSQPGWDGVDQIVAVDRSLKQLELLDRAVKPWIERSTRGAELTMVNEDLFRVLKGGIPHDSLVIISYLTMELTPSQNVELRNLLRGQLAQGSGEALIVESDDQGRGIVAERLDGTRFLVAYDQVSLDLPSLGALGLEAKPKFAERQSARDLLHEYFRAWETHDTDLVRRLFLDDATYEILGAKTLRGVNEIEAYWNENQRTQRFVRCHVREWLARDNWVVADWAASFERTDVLEHRLLSGLLWMELADGRIKRFTESYRQRRTPLAGQSTEA